MNVLKPGNRLCLVLAFVWLLMPVLPVKAHTLYMNLVDNEDGTVTVEAMFSTGASGAGLPLYLENEKQEVIKKLVLDENGEATFEIPDQAYTIFLDGGPGHTVREEGPKNP